MLASLPFVPSPPSPPKTLTLTTRRSLISWATALVSSSSSSSSSLLPSSAASPPLPPRAAGFFEIPASGGVKALDLRVGAGETPVDGDQVAIHYYGRLAAKQGWRFDSTYDHKDEIGDPVPFLFIVGSGKVISGIQAAVKSMKVGGIRRVIIPPSQGFLIGRGCLPPFLIRLVFPIEKALPLALLSLILSL
ncbi:peptidyl-prolyl cis-trans isomerase FKBP17-1, chloroplastic-like isoform X3 [Phoenix dactylifera]|uniref:peptidylprolyl isomerase n=1 Tax=Phoenix dactylifera TaxID=42345 RepID=A0A8B9AXE0_PHODC|nr:peptidyl-prolyl cis-trans isomerase FKBP17-1, chloroplastic-like isoform X3 [Phoenix dactylifera]